jgi:translocator protein
MVSYEAEYWCLTFYVFVLIANVLSNLHIFRSTAKYISTLLEHDENHSNAENNATESIPVNQASKFTPTRWTLLIWILLYVWQGITILWSLWEKGVWIDRIAPYYVIACVYNIGWCISNWFGKVNVSSYLSLGLLSSAIVCYIRLDISYFPLDQEKLWIYNIPFSLLLGWMSISVILTFFAAKWIRVEKEVQSIAYFMLAISVPLTYVPIYRHDYFYSGAVLWGITGVLINNTHEIGVVQSCLVVYLTSACSIIISLFIW